MNALFAGSFHPPTNGHKDIILRSAKMFDHVYVAVMFNAEKKYTMDVETRMEMLRKITCEFPNVSVVSDTGLTCKLAEKLGCGVLVRGIRNAQDLTYETPIADANRSLTGIDTVYLTCLPEHSFISSTIVNDILSHQGDISHMVPSEILSDIISAASSASKGV